MKRIKTILLLMLSLTGTACSGFPEEYSQDLAKVESWEDLNELLLGDGYMNSSYLIVSNYITTGDINYNLEILNFMADELEENVQDDYADILNFRDKMFAFYTWQQDTGMDDEGKFTGGDEVYWNRLYKHINTANMVIALADEQPEANEKDRLGKASVKGEAHFLRAAYYFLLVNLYAQPYQPGNAATTPGVPVKLTEYVEDREFMRDPVADVYAQILLDLEQAEASLQEGTPASIYHAGLTAVYLLQSRVYLYMQDWERAAERAGKVLERQSALRNLHTLSPGDVVLTASSPETIFSMGGHLSASAFADIDGRYPYEPAYYISDDMANLYKNGDLRKQLYIGESSAGFSPVLTKVNGQRTGYGKYHEVSDCFLLRTAEAYLNLAEAAACSGDEGTARRTLSTFLATRMSEPAEVTESGEALAALIRDERARELLFEGHRWFDLRRYSVRNPYPYTKVIEHGHTFYENGFPSYTDYYRLEENDKAYTLPIPRNVYSFQVSMGNNERPARTPAYTVTY